LSGSGATNEPEHDTGDNNDYERRCYIELAKHGAHRQSEGMESYTKATFSNSSILLNWIPMAVFVSAMVCSINFLKVGTESNSRKFIGIIILS
jgi:hypothetical protein